MSLLSLTNPGDLIALGVTVLWSFLFIAALMAAWTNYRLLVLLFIFLIIVWVLLRIDRKGEL